MDQTQWLGRPADVIREIRPVSVWTYQEWLSQSFMVDTVRSYLKKLAQSKSEEALYAYAFPLIVPMVRMESYLVAGMRDSHGNLALPKIRLSDGKRYVDNDYDRLFRHLGFGRLYRQWLRQMSAFGGSFMAVDTTGFYLMAPGNTFVIYDPLTYEIIEVFHLLLASPEEAGIDAEGETFVIYVDHWTRKDHTRYILSHSYSVLDKPIDEKPHPFGRPPVAFIARDRVEKFWGKSLVEDIVDAVKKLVEGMGDIADGVYRANNATGVVWNAQNKGPYLLKAGQLTDIGVSIGTTTRPGASLLNIGGEAIRAGNEFTKEQLSRLRQSVFMPDEVWGEAQASQRASMAMAMRLLPTHLMVSDRRDEIAQAIELLVGLVYKMAVAFPGYELPDPENLSISVQFPSMTPRDETQTHNNIGNDVANRIISPQSAQGLLYPQLDPEEETQRTLEFWRELNVNPQIQVPGSPEGRREAAQQEGQAGGQSQEPDQGQ